jgi:lysozyme
MDHRRRSPARLLAPIALVAFMLAFFAVIVGSDTTEDSDGSNASRQEQNADTTGTGETTTTTTGPSTGSAFYTVKTGDTLAGIAGSVGVTVEHLQELNPDLDPQTLVSGQKIRLRE